MATISLESAIRTCKVDTAYANKVESDRFLNPSLMMCPVWNGLDTTGRQVCPDSYWTKRAGCNSAQDRVLVENSVSRPQYMEYINLSAQGIDGAIYGNTMPWNEVGQTSRELDAANKITGNFGLQFGASTYPGCNYYPYEQALKQEEAQAKKQSNLAMAMNANMDMPSMDALNTAEGYMEGMDMEGMNMEGMNMEEDYVGRPPQRRERFEFYENYDYAPSQVFAQDQTNFRQQQALQQGFIGNDFRRSSGC